MWRWRICSVQTARGFLVGRAQSPPLHCHLSDGSVGAGQTPHKRQVLHCVERQTQRNADKTCAAATFHLDPDIVSPQFLRGPVEHSARESRLIRGHSVLEQWSPMQSAVKAVKTADVTFNETFETRIRRHARRPESCRFDAKIKACQHSRLAVVLSSRLEENGHTKRKERISRTNEDKRLTQHRHRDNGYSCDSGRGCSVTVGRWHPGRSCCRPSWAGSCRGQWDGVDSPISRGYP